MPKLNTKAFALYLKSGDTLPTPPANFIELSEKLLIAGKPNVEEISRFNGKRNAFDSEVDTCDTTVEGETLAHKMRTNNKAGDALDTVPEYAEMLKIAGFTEAIDTTVVGEETVTYTLDTTAIPPKGSGIYYLNGKKQTMTSSVALDLTFNFEVGKPTMINAPLSAFIDNKGISTDEANPATLLSEELPLYFGCSDIVSKGAKVAKVKSGNIALNSTINKEYSTGEREYSSDDTNVKANIAYNVEADEYNDAILALQNETYFDLVFQVGTVNGVMTSGKSVEFKITNVKFSDFADSDNQDKLSREDTLLMTAKSQMTISMGYFAP